MTLQEILKAKGLSDDQIKEVVGEMKQNKIFTASEENMDIRYNKLKGDFDSLTAQHGESTKLIEQLKAGTKNSEELQGKISNYETQVADLQKQLQDSKVNSALKVALLSEKVLDVPYMTFKIEESLKEQGKSLELDENENIKGLDDVIKTLKTQFPTQFETGKNAKKVLDGGKLPNTNAEPQSVTKEQFDKMGYNARVKLRSEYPDLYEKLTN